jgi:hypothetical protein
MDKSFPLGKREEPSLDDWKRLYESVQIFFDRKPWDVLDNSDLIAVVDPVSNVTSYCNILGNGGMEFGLQVYVGDVGLRAFGKILAEEADPREMLMEMRSIGLSFCTKGFLDKRDIAPIKKLFFPFRGDGWPQFRSYNPGFAPWYITSEEARLFLTCIEQTLVVAEEAEEDEYLVICEEPGGKILTRVSKDSGRSLRWKTEYRKFMVPADDPLPVWDADEFTIATLARKQTEKGLFWEVDCPPLPAPIHDTEPPRLARILVCIESTRGLALGKDFAFPNEEYPVGACSRLADILRSQERKPCEIHFRKPVLAEASSAFLKSIDIEPVLVEKLGFVEEFENGMEDHFFGKRKQ